MGNCLDNQTPPPKSHPSYFTARGYFVTRRAMSSASAMSSAYSVYQPYNAFGGFRSAGLHPFSGQSYSYPLEWPTTASVYYSDPSSLTSSMYEYYDNSSERATRYKKSHRQRDRRLLNGNDVNKRGHKFKESTSKREIGNGAISTTGTVANTITATTTNITDDDDIFQQNVQLHTQASTTSEGRQDINQVSKIFAQPKLNQEKLTKNESFLVIQEIADSEMEVIFDEQQVIRPSDTRRVKDILQLFDQGTQSEMTLEASLTVTGSDSMKQSQHMRHLSDVAIDVVVCYHAADVDVGRKITHKLKSAGLQTTGSYPTGDNGEDGLTNWLMFPQTVADAKIMVVLMSRHSVQDKHVNDEVCLAQLTETLIYPIALEKSLDLLRIMDIDLKLQLTSYQWTEFSEENNNIEFAIAVLVRNVIEDLESMNSLKVITKDHGSISQRMHRRRQDFRHRQMQRMISLENHVSAVQYWKQHYGHECDSVYWERLYDDLYKDCRKQFQDSIHKFYTPFMEGLKREMQVKADGIVQKTQFVEFGNNLGTDDHVLEKVASVAREIHAIKVILDVESTVRIVAIENIGNFCNQNVIVAFRELLVDDDSNIRAIVALSLSRAMSEGDQTTLSALMATLDDKDGLVRETGCFALGHLKAKEAVEKLHNTCHNDVLSQVRDAAAMALTVIQGNHVKDKDVLNNNNQSEMIYSLNTRL